MSEQLEKMKEKTESAEGADLDAATAWARANLHDGPHVVSAPIITMQAPFNFEPGQDGRGERRVHLPEQAIVRMPAGAPLLRLTWKVQFNGAGPAEYAGDGLRIHPRLACEGEEAVREALRERAEELRSEAARKLDRAARYDSLLEEEWETDWPAYWRDTGDGKLETVEE
jgi:hypothetical protein